MIIKNKIYVQTKLKLNFYIKTIIFLLYLKIKIYQYLLY